MFGQTSQPATTNFGFGAAQPNTLFGATTSTAPTVTFGATSSSSLPTSSVAAPTFGANTTTNFGFGNTNTSTAPTTNPSFGNNNNTTNPTFGFGNNNATSGAATTTTTTSAPSFTFGNTSTATATPAFGNTATSTAPTNSLFGATSTAPTNTLFGATSAAPTNSLFGGASATTTTSTTNPTTFGFGANTSTTTTQPQTQQPQHYLDLQHCFPDTNMSSYIVKPDSITRSTDLVNQLFSGNASRIYTQQQKAAKTSRDIMEFNEKPIVLPLFLSATDSNHSLTANNKSNPNSLVGKKRLLEEEKTITGREKSHKGVFGSSDSLADGFNKNLKKLENSDHLPKESVNDIGMNPTLFKKDVRFSASPLENHQPSVQESVEGSNTKTRVRVFGYDPNKTAEIIAFFSKLGELMEPYTSQGNWITFCYVSHEAALKALSYNGMNIDKDHMVGVTWDEKAKEIQLLQTSDKPMDLFKTGLFNDRKPQQKSEPQQQIHQETGLLNRLREKLMGW